MLENRPFGRACVNDTTIETFQNERLTFNTDHLLCIQVDMNESDFELMRNESRFGPSITEKDGATVIAVFLDYLRNCDVPWPSKFNWYQSRIIINGIKIDKVGIRKKGFLGSIFSPAPSIKIQTNRFTDNNLLGLTNDITLNNNSEDATRLKSTLIYKVFALADYPAPLCNLANVTINETPYGAYSHLEPIKEDFLIRNFGTVDGDLYEGQLADFIGDRLPRWQAKTDYTDPLASPIRNIANAIAMDNEALKSEIGKYLDLNAFIKFWALEVLVEHVDGYTANCNNFYVYFNPNNENKAVLIPWGMNYFNGVVPRDSNNTDNMLTPYVKSELPRRLSRVPEYKKLFELELKRLINEVWNENELIALVDDLAVQVKTSEINSDYDNQIDDLKSWILNRKGQVELMLEMGLPDGKKNPPKGCLW